MRKLIVANWKANPQSTAEAVRLVRAIELALRKSRTEVVIAPPLPFLLPVRRALSKVKLGAQDVFWQDRGPYTGEVTPSQLKNLGVVYVIVGHSERRRWLSETDEMINKKVKAAIKSGIRPIFCVGEPMAIRRQSLAAVKRFVKAQLAKGLAGLSVVNCEFLVVTYEPIWAISTVGGRADRPEDAVKMISFIRSWLALRFGTAGERVRILYGGSVNGKNARDFLKHSEIQGALVGGASLHAKEFLRICKSV